MAFLFSPFHGWHSVDYPAHNPHSEECGSAIWLDSEPGGHAQESAMAHFFSCTGARHGTLKTFLRCWTRHSFRHGLGAKLSWVLMLLRWQYVQCQLSLLFRVHSQRAGTVISKSHLPPCKISPDFCFDSGIFWFLPHRKPRRRLHMATQKSPNMNNAIPNSDER